MNVSTQSLRPGRVLVIALAGLIVIFGIVLVIILLSRPSPSERGEPVNALTNSTDSCVTCHDRTTPGIVFQYGHSTMAGAKVNCQDCHVVKADYPGAVEHEDTYVLQSPTSAMCEKCHQAEVAQYNQSRHGLPAYVAVAGAQGLPVELQAAYEAIPEGLFAPDKSRNAIAELEGQAVTKFACEGCHDVGRPAPDGSVGQCQKCHLRHEFSLEQARKPETCNACHIGPDHPQWEIYTESPHGIAYMTGEAKFNWDAESGTLTVKDFPAPTCATCHFSGFGQAGTSHDVGDRLSWYLFAPVSERRPSWQDNLVRMQGVCLECHNKNFIEDFYTAADAVVGQVNDWVRESDDIMQPLKDQNLLTSAPFDQPVDFTYFELWHHWGRTAKFGTWMQGPDYVQWHGAYELLSDLAELRMTADELMKGAGQ
jgi:hydroxylamine dehydrogenase